MGHGTHWRTVLSNAEDDIGLVLDFGFTRGEIAGKRRYSKWHGPNGLERADVTLVQALQSGFGSLGIVVAGDSLRSYLHSAFPIAIAERSHAIRVLEIHESSFGLEACITAELGQAEITFFEPYYALNAHRYRPGAALQVLLTGIVYQLEVLASDQSISHPEIGEIRLDGAAVLLAMGRPDPFMLPENGFGLAYILKPSDRPGPDDYSFRGRIKDIQAVDFLRRPAWRITATLLRMEGNETDMCLHVLDENIRSSRRPALGSDIAGTLWLQGLAPLVDSSTPNP